MSTPKSAFRTIVVALTVVCLMQSACNSQGAHNVKLQRQWNAKTREVADLLAGVKDVPSAKAAGPKLNTVLQELDAINSQLDKSYDPENVDAGELGKMTKEVAEGIAETQRMNVETIRISKSPDVVAALGDTWRKLPSVFMLEASGAFPKSQPRSGEPRP
jgi:hypothetical protein